MFSNAFWKAATERAIKTGAQFALVTLGFAATGISGDSTVNAFLLDYPTLGGVFLGGILVSYLTSIVSTGVSGSGPSITRSETLK